MLCGAQVRLTCSDHPCHMARVRCSGDAVREIYALALAQTLALALTLTLTPGLNPEP